MKLTPKSWLIVGLSAFLFTDCTNKQNKKMPTPKVDIVKVTSFQVPFTEEYVGSIFGFKDIPIRARVEGYLETIDFEEGSVVDQGDLLYTIDAQPFNAQVAEAQSRVAEAETKLVNAENELARYKPLGESKAVSQSDVDAAQATRDAAVATLNAAKANLKMAEINLSYATMKSPIKGIIGKTNAKVGEFVGRDPNPVILNTVSRLDTVRVQFFLSETQFLEVVNNVLERKSNNEGPDEGRTKLSLTLSDGTEYPHEGHVDFLDRNVSETTGAILVEASFPNPGSILRPGLYAKVKITYQGDKKTIVIPQRAVIETQGQYSVKVVSDSNTIETRQVELGTPINNGWVVRSGLKLNEQIVIEGLGNPSGATVEPTLTDFKINL
jgi:membrane fusion protein (multidrug efflux system)